MDHLPASAASTETDEAKQATENTPIARWNFDEFFIGLPEFGTLDSGAPGANEAFRFPVHGYRESGLSVILGLCYSSKTNQIA